jgi:hypothetical protein
MDLIEQLRKEYTLKQIEEFCGMPRRTLQPSIKVPKKYFPKLKQMASGVEIIELKSSIESVEPRIVIKEVEKIVEVIKEVLVPSGSIEVVPTHTVIGRDFCYIKPDGGHGRYIPKNGENYYLIPEKE